MVVGAIVFGFFADKWGRRPVILLSLTLGGLAGVKEGEKKAIDQTKWHTDGLRQGRSHGFSVLLGICLSDTSQDFQGNLLLWPGSHLEPSS